MDTLRASRQSTYTQNLRFCSYDLLANALDDGDVHQVDQLRRLEAHVLDGDALVLVEDGDAVDDLDAGHVLDEVRQVRFVDGAAEGPALAVASADERMQVAAQAVLDLALDAIRLADGAPHQRHLERDLDVARLDAVDDGTDQASLVEIVLHEAQELGRRDEPLGQI